MKEKSHNHQDLFIAEQKSLCINSIPSVYSFFLLNTFYKLLKLFLYENFR